ncbi:MAG: hypothetical protein P8N25_00270 [Alphaproteobacteria bacterium]|nr:hypothetical protein [Alphaproteobacteria bacterium]
MYIDEIKKKKVTRLQDYTLEELKEIERYKKACKTRRCEQQSKIPEIFFKLAKQEKIIYSSYYHFEKKYPCTVEGIQELSSFAEQGYIGAMRALSKYFAEQGEVDESPWWYLMVIQKEAEKTLEEEKKRIEEEKIKRKEEQERKRKQAERIKKAEERERYIKEQLPAERAKQIEKYGCIMPKGLMKG